MDENTASDELLFDVLTPLNFRVRVTRVYWELIATIKHPAQNVGDTLQYPSEIRQSRSDSRVYLFYKPERLGRWVCAVAKRLNGNGFLITAYPTDSIKEGNMVWHR